MTLDLASKKNPYLLVVLGDFNAKLRQWYDEDSSTSEGVLIENITSQFGLHQIINEPTHILENSSSCIDLIFTSQPNLSVESGTQSSLHPNCHHQIIYTKFNLEVIYPPPYARKVWHYQDSNVDLIRRSMNEFDWDRGFANKHVNENVLIFNKTVLNVLSNFILHEAIVCDDKDPPWFNRKIKSLFNEKLRTYNAYCKNSNNIQLRNNLRSLQQRLRDLIDDSKQKYFLTLFRMGIFGAAHGCWGVPKNTPSLKSVRHILQWWNLAVIPYLKKIQKNIWITWRTPDFCWHQYFFIGNQ